MNWENMISVVIGGIIATLSALVASSFSAKKERDRLILEQKIDAFLEFIPIIQNRFEVDGLKIDDIRPFVIPKIKLLSSKVTFFCNTKTRVLINELIKTLIKYNRVSCSRSEIDKDTGPGELFSILTKVIPDYCEKIQSSLIDEIDRTNNKPYNYQKGFFRLTVIVSTLTGFIGLFLIIIENTTWIDRFLYITEKWGLIIFGFAGVVWILYLFLRYIIVGYVLYGFKE
jgi:hypothetical protein